MSEGDCQGPQEKEHRQVHYEHRQVSNYLSIVFELRAVLAKNIIEMLQKEVFQL